MSVKIALGIPEELNEMILQACAVSGRSRNSACIEYLLRGVREELESYQKLGYIQKVTPIKLNEIEDEESDL